jgi:hypothetical protein
MKKLACEMCGSIDLIKQDGLFVCQNCGTKYSVEEAKKMMIEGTVEVTGTVKVDNLEKKSNLYVLARRAREDSDYENMEKFYGMIQVEDPNSWEAAFFSVYPRVMRCKLGEIESVAIIMNNSIENVMKLIKKTVSNEQEQLSAVIDVTTHVRLASLKLYSASKENFGEKDSNLFVVQSMQVVKILYNLGDQIELIYGDHEGLCQLAVSAWKIAIEKTREMMLHLLSDATNRNECLKYVKSYTNKIQKYDPDYTPTKGSCYVATAIYESYDCPQVWTLRRYRDNTLANSWHGRTLIHLYYATSPIIVKRFGQTVWLKKLWRGILDLIVKRLQDQGIESTPYIDKNW